MPLMILMSLKLLLFENIISRFTFPKIAVLFTGSFVAFFLLTHAK